MFLLYRQKKDKIVSIQEHVEDKKHKLQLAKYRNKVETIQKIIQCSACHFKCAMCGLHVKPGESSKYEGVLLMGLTFCESCRDEFEDFLSVSKGEKEDDVFWHNKAWAGMWSAWINYRKAIDAFTESPEFKLLLRELNRQH